MDKHRRPAVGDAPDHRSLSARIKRENTRLRILQATMSIFSSAVDDAPVIEDVVKEANISRGTFYKYFDSLDQALVAASRQANDRMIADIDSVYEFLNEPWQRACVGFRVYMVHALQDPSWSAFMTRMDAWSQGSAITQRMTSDFYLGKHLGQFQIDDVDTAVDFIIGASLGGVYAISKGVSHPDTYMDAAVGMAMCALGCSASLRAQAVAFSRKHLNNWCAEEGSRWSTLLT